MSLEKRVDAAIDKAIAEERIVGAVVMVARGSECLFVRAAGFADREAQTPVSEDTIFRLASVTKPVVATTALAMIDKGLLSLDDKVTDVLPWFHPPGPDGRPSDIRIRHLLTHTSGLDYSGGADVLPDGEAANAGLTDTDLDFETNFSRLNAVPLAFDPGTRWTYSVAIDVLGAAIAAVDGGTLEEAVKLYVTGPLGMDDTRFFVTDETRLATPYADGSAAPIRMGARETVRKEPDIEFTFEPSRIFNPNAYQSGGAGMAGTAGDILKLLQSWLDNDGMLAPETANAALSNQIGTVDVGPGVKFGFVGSVVTDPHLAETALPSGAVTWGGVYGNCWAVDPASGTIGVILTNTALEGCMGAFPNEVWSAIFGS